MAVDSVIAISNVTVSLNTTDVMKVYVHVCITGASCKFLSKEHKCRRMEELTNTCKYSHVLTPAFINKLSELLSLDVVCIITGPF